MGDDNIMKSKEVDNINEDDFSASHPDLNSASQFLKRRDFTRFITEHININIELEVQPDSGEKTRKILGKVLNLSKQGVTINTNALLSISQRINFKLFLPSSYGCIQGIGRIMWGSEKKKHFQYGISLYDIKSEKELKNLEQYFNDKFTEFEIIDRRQEDRREKKRKGVHIDKRKIDRRTNKPLFLKCIRYNRMKKLFINFQIFKYYLKSRFYANTIGDLYEQKDHSTNRPS